MYLNLNLSCLFLQIYFIIYISSTYLLRKIRKEFAIIWVLKEIRKECFLEFYVSLDMDKVLIM